MNALLASEKEILTPIADALHISGVAKTVYRYLSENPFMAWIIAAFAVLMITAIVLIIVLSVKAHKHTKAIRDIEEHPQVPSAAIETTEKKSEESRVETSAAEDPVQELAATEVKSVETPAAEEPVETPVEIPAEKSASNPKKAATKTKAAAIAEAPATPVAEVAEDKKQIKYRGKWVLYKLSTATENGEEKEEVYFFELHASNGEKLLESQEYTSLAGARKGIETHLTNIKNGNFKLSLTKKGTYIFKLMNAKGMLLCTGENYTSRARCESAIESTKRFAETAVLDEFVQEIVVKVPADEENAATAPAAEGAVGKWVVSKETNDLGEDSYYFELFANNGEKLLSSEDYTSQNGALSGLETHKKNIAQGNFRIALTKRGDYIFKLLNGNNQLLCLGEHYKTRRLCQSAVESVKRFALTSPTVNE